MSSQHISTPGTHAPLTRRAFLRSLAVGAASAALLAPGGTVAASGARPNRETGSAPVIGELNAFSSEDTTVVSQRFERRTPE